MKLISTPLFGQSVKLVIIDTVTLKRNEISFKGKNSSI